MATKPAAPKSAPAKASGAAPAKAAAPAAPAKAAAPKAATPVKAAAPAKAAAPKAATPAAPRAAAPKAAAPAKAAPARAAAAGAAAAKPLPKPADEAVAFLSTLRTQGAESGAARWYEGAIVFDWDGKIGDGGKNNCKWVNITYNIGDMTNVGGFRFKGEVHKGTIPPMTEADLAEMQASFKQKKGGSFREMSVRKQPKVQVNFNKYKIDVKTESDGFTVCKDSEGNEVYPGDEHLSVMYQLGELINDAFQTEIALMVEQGRIVATTKAKEENEKKGVKGRIFVHPTMNKVASMIQTAVSESASSRAGAALVNPIHRIGIDFDEKSGVPNIGIHDKELPVKSEDGKRTLYEKAKVGKDLVCAANIHRFLRSGCVLDGIAAYNAICFSSMGISLPAKMKIVVVAAPVSKSNKYDLSDMGDEYGTDAESETKSEEPSTVNGDTAEAEPVAEPEAEPEAEPAAAEAEAEPAAEAEAEPAAEPEAEPAAAEAEPAAAEPEAEPAAEVSAADEPVDVTGLIADMAADEGPKETKAATPAKPATPAKTPAKPATPAPKAATPAKAAAKVATPAKTPAKTATPAKGKK